MAASNGSSMEIKKKLWSCVTHIRWPFPANALLNSEYTLRSKWFPLSKVFKAPLSTLQLCDYWGGDLAQTTASSFNPTQAVYTHLLSNILRSFVPTTWPWTKWLASFPAARSRAATKFHNCYISRQEQPSRTLRAAYIARVLLENAREWLSLSEPYVCCQSKWKRRDTE